MKAARIGIFALAASLSLINAAAQDGRDPAIGCIDALAAEPRLALIADKVSLTRGENLKMIPGLQRAATEEERAAVAVWLGMRKDCFDAGDEYRRKVMNPAEHALAKGAFVFQQRLLGQLQEGSMTYGQFNSRRAELVERLDSEI